MPSRAEGGKQGFTYLCLTKKKKKKNAITQHNFSQYHVLDMHFSFNYH